MNSMESNYVKISDFGNIITGKTPKTSINEYWNGPYQFITPTDIPTFDTKNLISTERTISETGKSKQKGTLLPIGTICVSCIATIGKVCQVNKPAITNQQINSIIPNEKYDSNYLYYLFRYNLPYLECIGGGTGSGTPIINKGKFSKLQLKVFTNKFSQEKIGKLLSNYDSLIENNNKRINLLENIAEKLYKEWFVHFRYPGYKNDEFIQGIPISFKFQKFCEIYTANRGISYSTEEIECEDGMNLVNLKNINSYGGFRRDGLKKYSGKYKQNQIVKFNDLVMGVTDMTQDRRTVGAVALIPNIMGVISADLIKLVSPIDNVFSYCMFKYGFYSKMISQFGNGANVIHLKPQSIKNQKILIPNEGLIDRFVRIVKPIIEEIENYNKANNNLVKQRDALLPRLMSGKLSVEGKEIL